MSERPAPSLIDKPGPRCSSCDRPYDRDAFTVCSNSFHCCRDCVWSDGRAIALCPRCYFVEDQDYH